MNECGNPTRRNGDHDRMVKLANDPTLMVWSRLSMLAAPVLFTIVIGLGSLIGHSVWSDYLAFKKEEIKTTFILKERDERIIDALGKITMTVAVLEQRADEYKRSIERLDRKVFP